MQRPTNAEAIGCGIRQRGVWSINIYQVIDGLSPNAELTQIDHDQFKTMDQKPQLLRWIR